MHSLVPKFFTNNSKAKKKHRDIFQKYEDSETADNSNEKGNHIGKRRIFNLFECMEFRIILSRGQNANYLKAI